jgi:hypothetical protein
MGRGLGSFQHHLLDALASTVTSSMNELRWRVWDRRGHAGVITKRFLNQFRHAVSKLEERRRIRVYQRHLLGLEEMATVFPFKTLDPEVRASRTLLLPDLCRLAANQPKYAPGRVEAFLLAKRRVEVAQTSVDWIPLEQRLAELIADRTTRHWAIPLLSKGREVFLGGSTPSDDSFAALIERAGTASREPVISKIREIFDALLPPDERNVSQLRSQIHGLIEMPRHGASRLKERIPRQLIGRYQLRAHKIDRLVTREALQMFEFVERIGAEPRTVTADNGGRSAKQAARRSAHEVQQASAQPSSSKCCRGGARHDHWRYMLRARASAPPRFTCRAARRTHDSRTVSTTASGPRRRARPRTRPRPRSRW